MKKNKTTSVKEYCSYVGDFRNIVYENDRLKIVTIAKKGCEIVSHFFYKINDTWIKYCTAVSKVTTDIINYAFDEFKAFKIAIG